jgi:excisionase family DNA binding protein
MTKRQPIPPEMKLWLHVDEASEVSGLSRSKLYECMRNGKLESDKVEGRRLIRPKALKALIEGSAK